MGKKQDVLREIYRICEQRGDYVIDNELVRAISRDIGFGNHFDATKLDNKSILPDFFVENDIALVHLGSGKHKFVKGLHNVYHDFEPVTHSIDWPYKKSLLNEYNTSESNILSVANNQRILHHFLFGLDKEFANVDIHDRPKTYFPHRTNANLRYRFGNDFEVSLTRMQIEIDLTIEYQGTIGIFEAKNGSPDNFSVYQLYHPFLYYYNAKVNTPIGGNIGDIVCVYVVRVRQMGISELNLWAYTFTVPDDITSIQFEKATKYRLIRE